MKAEMKDYRVKELSWLSFNARLLQEACDPSVPLISRIRFLGIYSSNLDEFFEIRVATLRRIAALGKKGIKILGSDPTAILSELNLIVARQQTYFNSCYNDILEELKNRNIFIINEREINSEQGTFLSEYFIRDVRPRIFPIMITKDSPVPVLKDRAIYLMVKLSHRSALVKPNYSLIQIPSDTLPRFVILPGVHENKYLIMLDDIIRYRLNEIYSMFDYESIECYDIKVTRDAELDIDDDLSSSLLSKISKSLKKRNVGHPVRIGYDAAVPKETLHFFLKKMNIRKNETLMPGGRYHNHGDFVSFPNLFNDNGNDGGEKILHKGFVGGKTMISAIEEKDILLHFPYHSFNHVIDFIREASIDPQVTTIKITLYRLAKNSNIINALINAKRNGKKVTVLIELQARFDEGANIRWADILKEEGVKVIVGIQGLKVHSKICLITRIDKKNQPKDYCFVGTGNFNETTANIYTDHLLLTADKEITAEMKALFGFFEKPYKQIDFNRLLVSPFNMKKMIIKFIKAETENAHAGKEAAICLKVNNLTDPEIIFQLYEAGRSGVKIRLLVRGMFSLVPGLKELSDNIEARGIVDKYLEHSRILIFHNGGDDICFLSSGDLMTRNFETRIEVGCQIVNQFLKKEMIDLFNLCWSDNTKSRILDSDLSNRYFQGDSEKKIRSQIEIKNYLMAR